MLNDTIKVNYFTLLSFVEEIFNKVGYSKEHSQIIAECICNAELRGIPSHGIIRIPNYLQQILNKKINIKPNIKIIYKTPTTTTFDADSSLGIIAAKIAMEHTIEKAYKNYISQTVVINSTHFGIAAYYALLAVKNNMIGIVCTNSQPIVAPTLGKERMLGTNPLAIAIPSLSYPPFVADFSTTPTNRGKIDLYEKQNKKLPLGWVIDKEGKPTDSPSALREGGSILPLGSTYELGSHKGYCISAIIDIFSGVLGGANFGPFVPAFVNYISNSPNNVGKGLGHFFGAIRIDSFRPASEFLKTMDIWIETLKNTKPIDPNHPVLIPGEPELINEKFYLKNGIPINISTINEIICELKNFNINLNHNFFK